MFYEAYLPIKVLVPNPFDQMYADGANISRYGKRKICIAIYSLFFTKSRSQVFNG